MLHGAYSVAQWLRHYATSREVAGSRPDEILLHVTLVKFWQPLQISSWNLNTAKCHCAVRDSTPLSSTSCLQEVTSALHSQPIFHFLYLRVITAAPAYKNYVRSTFPAHLPLPLSSLYHRSSCLQKVTSALHSQPISTPSLSVSSCTYFSKVLVKAQHILTTRYSPETLFMCFWYSFLLEVQVQVQVNYHSPRHIQTIQSSISVHSFHTIYSRHAD
jgi:hypothetical protein